ncbi:MAG: glycerol-3-phosphate 1-O-acyltransferase PlsY [Verrucomicrobia bacterium]|nr:glycerol-3-phosphate 1-O-acyltransferase PlsY [Verrucomicrobiota bacterium]
MAWLLITVLSYSIGSTPWGYIFARSKGIDIRRHGSGNIGTANVLRVMGKKWGYLVFLCDFLKGFLAVKFSSLIAACFGIDVVYGSIIAAIASVLGHNYSFWLGFKGGKGIATSAGAILALFPPLVFVSALLVWISVFFVSRYTSLASMIAAAALPIGVLFFASGSDRGFPWQIGFSICIAGLAIWRHRSNIIRLLKGTENQFRRK